MKASAFRDIWARVMFFKFSKLHEPQAFFFTNRTPLNSITISYQFDWTWGDLIYMEPPSWSAKENAQKVEFVVLFQIKWKLSTQLRSGSLCSKRSNRWEEDLFAANQVSDMAAKQDEVRRNAREIFSTEVPGKPENRPLVRSTNGSGIIPEAWSSAIRSTPFCNHVILLTIIHSFQTHPCGKGMIF